MEEVKKDLTENHTYLVQLGIFHQNWSSVDGYTDFAICKYLRVTNEQAHLITSGMMFGRKARLLADLLRHSQQNNKKEIITAFNKLRAIKRDVIAHSYVDSDENSVNFLERSISGEFRARKNRFTLEEFIIFNKELYDALKDFKEAIGAGPEEVDAFLNAMFSLNRKS